ncbi:MAG: CarD family transcriptional regulator, partial [Nitrospinaceae bacterium]
MAVTVAAPTKGHVQRIQELLMDRDLAVRVDHGRISAGFILPGSGAVLVGEQEIFGRAHKHRQRRRNRVGRFQRGFQDLKKGDLLVHVDYGIGKYMGARDLKTGVGGGEFLEIQFADDGRLYIPMDGLGAIQKYGGSGDTPPPLNKLGGVTWKRQKKKVKEAIRKMAEELVKIYASRQLAESQVYHPDPILMQEFADSFEYVETEDQLKAIEDIMADLETGKPMDRLVCGDVGYGKTEVAMRAAFKVVLGKKQV